MWALCMLLPLGASAGCSYEYPEPINTATLDPARTSESPQAFVDPLVLEREVKNYAALDLLLKAVPGPVLLTVTAACIGATRATVSIGQEHPGAPFQPMALGLDCAGAASQVIALQPGDVFAHLLLPGPGDTPWTGAVGGVRVTGTGSG